MSEPKDSDYAVGFGKPPEHSRFQPGQSGNPKGRPKGALNLATALNRALKEKVFITEGGQRKQITKLDATIKALVNRAVKGDARAVQQMLSLGPLVGVEPVGTAVVGADDAALMAGLMERLRCDRADGTGND